MIDFTPLIRPLFLRRARQIDKWKGRGVEIQTEQLRNLLSRAKDTAIGCRYGFTSLLEENDISAEYTRRVPLVDYEDMREDVMRMVRGDKDVLWPGRCLRFAQSSGTSGASSKYIPVTPYSLRHNHIRGGFDSVAHYLRTNPHSRMFSGKGLVLGGSFDSKLKSDNVDVKIGDLSATLIDCTPLLGALFKVPQKKIALMGDWEEKLPAMTDAVKDVNVTNISGVPSWMMTVLREVMRKKRVENLHDVWPGLEVFFHGGIAFGPYKEQYDSFTDTARMHYRETYNASEGFFAVQDIPEDKAMLMLIDSAVYYEFIPINSNEPIEDISHLKIGEIYELVITTSSGLWRYRIGDTVKVSSVDPLKITIAGRTKSYINAFGEELMEHNADDAISKACRMTGAAISNYTVCPIYASTGEKAHHQWLIEFTTMPSDLKQFGAELDRELQRLNSDYEAKRAHDIFLDSPAVIALPSGSFERWLASYGSKRLGGQRKVPRLSNSDEYAVQLLNLQLQ